MLDTTTKKRIDDCRDILVGKLPDPKAQIEQITIGLIYKFMDDMDKEAIELGGTAKFFSGDYEKYAWDKLFDTKVTAAEMLNLYSDAIVSMDKNPNIPGLFRDIFKNAFLPYRDPETLKLFLKTIGEFEYTHSEKLGDAFEYLLSVMGSQGDAGQFRTPRHIIDFLVAIIDPDKGETILDPACGTAGFLISAYKHILLKYSTAAKSCGLANIFSYNQAVQTQNFASRQFNNLGDALTPDDRKKLIQNFAGYDISPDMVRLSLVNLYLHGFSDPHISEYDTLSSEDRWNENFDVVLANPPFMSPKGGIRPHKKFTIASNRSEVLFVDYIAEHLNPKGKAGIIVPEGVIFQSGKAYKALRKMLVEDYLYAVVSLPAGVFNPYSGVKTSILLMDKTIAKQRNEILFVKIDNDGYNLGAQRTAIKGSQLEDAIKIIHDFIADDNGGRDAKFCVSTDEQTVSTDDKQTDRDAKFCVPKENTQIAHTVPKTEIAANGDYNLSGERYRITTDTESVFPLLQLSEAVELVRGITFGKSNQLQQSNENSIKVATTKAAQEDGIVYDALYDVPKEFLKSEEKLLRVGDILMSTANSLNLLGRVTYIDKLNEDITFGAFMTLLRPKKNKIHPKLLFQLLKSENAKHYYFSNANTTTNISNLKFEDLNNFQIPLPPLSIQEEIVAEIEGYQKIIDGAKAVVANYKPKIDINPDWEMVELGEVCEMNPKKSEIKDLDESLEVSFVPMADLNENQIDFTPKQTKKLSEVYKGYTYFKEDDVLLAKVTPCFENGKAGIANGLKNHIGFGSSEYFVLRPNEKILSTWIYLNIITDSFRKKGKLNMTGTGGLQRVPPDFVKNSFIPLPNNETQRQIVAQIEKEQALVNANKQLIEIFEQKIKDRIAKVWGTKETQNIASPQNINNPSPQKPVNMAAEPAKEYGKE
ncbi:MAG: N-6 DNA methylase [Chitinophagales bacterium]